MAKVKDSLVLEFYKDYVDLRDEGMTHEEALEGMDYLHPLTLSRLEKYIAENFPIET